MVEEEIHSQNEWRNFRTPNILTFIDSHDKQLGIPSTLVAIVLFIVWASRSGLDLLFGVLCIVFYSILVLVPLRIDNTELRIKEIDSLVRATITRPGVSWKYILDALCGWALLIMLTWFTAFSSLPQDSSLPNLIMILAMIASVLIHPLPYMIANCLQESWLKTRISILYDRQKNEYLEFAIEPSTFDRQLLGLDDSGRIRVMEKIEPVLLSHLDIEPP